MFSTKLLFHQKRELISWLFFPAIVVAQTLIPTACLKTTPSRISWSVGKLEFPLEKQD